MKRKKGSKGSGWECCYANNIFGTFRDEMRASGRNWSNFAHTNTHAATLVVEMKKTNLLSGKKGTSTTVNIP